MQDQPSRRGFLRTAGRICAGGIAGISGLDAVRGFPAVGVADAKVTPDLVRLRPEIEPLVKLMESTSREKCPELLAEKLKAGVPYRQLLAAAYLTAVRGGGHHSVYLVHSAHQLSLDVAPGERMLPLFWAVDVIKEHLHRFKHPVAERLTGKLVAPEKTAGELEVAMKSRDTERAERAVLSLVRARGAWQTMEQLWRHGARDWRFIGHLPISVASAARTLKTIGWQHAEPVLRQVIRDLFRWGRGSTSGQPYEANRNRAEKSAGKLPPGWASTRADPEATLELFGVLREGDWKPACEWASDRIVGGKVTAGSVWDAVHLAAADFMVRFKLGGRRIANRALHSNTSSNALHHAFRVSSDDGTRFFLLLQAVGWVAGFVGNEKGRAMLRDIAITELEPVALPESPVNEIFETLPPREFLQEIEDRAAQDRASRLALAYGKSNANPAPFFRAARSLLCRKATLNSHDYKFPVAIFEEIAHVSPRWRPHLLAASVHFLHGTKMTDSPVIVKAREVMGR